MKKLLSIAVIAMMALAAKAQSAGSPYETLPSTDLHVWAEFPDPIVADGETVNYIKVYEHDDQGLDYTAFNMEIILPQGFKLNQVKKGRDMVNDIFLTERASSTHGISCNLYEGYDLRIICTSTQNDDLYTDDEEGNPLDELFTVGLIADPSLATGDYHVQMEGIKFCIKTGDARIPDPDVINYTIRVKSSNEESTTAIEEISADEIDSQDCYDLTGRKVDPAKSRGLIVVSHGKKYMIR